MSRTRIFRDPYSLEEVTVLVEEYEELNGERSKAWVQVRLMDIDRAYAALPPVHKEAVMLCGFMGISITTAGRLLDVYPMKMWRRYTNGLDYLVAYLNGGA